MILDGLSVNILTAKPHRGLPTNSVDYEMSPKIKVIRAPIIQMKIIKSRKFAYILHDFSFMITSLFFDLLKTGSTYDYYLNRAIINRKYVLSNYSRNKMTRKLAGILKKL